MEEGIIGMDKEELIGFVLIVGIVFSNKYNAY